MRGKRPNTIPTKGWKVRLPIPLADRVDELLRDPLFDKPIYGARSKLVTALLTRWVEEMEEKGKRAQEALKDE